MQRTIRYAIVGFAAIQLSATLPSVAEAQGGPGHACSLVDAAQWRTITGRKDFGNQGLQASTPEQLKAGVTECDYLTISLTQTSDMTAERFARTRKSSEQNPDRWKTESISGLGDEAYYMWDPRPGAFRSVGLLFRTAGKQIAMGTQAPSDSIPATKQMLLTLAKATAPKVK